MAEQLPDPRRSRAKKRGAGKAAKTLEFVQRLDQIAKGHPASRLLVDLAQDAGMEIFNKQNDQLRRLWNKIARLRQKRDGLRDRLMSLGHALTTTMPLMPRLAGQPPSDPNELRGIYGHLKSHDFPKFAQTLHDRIGRSDVIAYQRLLTDEILIKGSRMLLEYMIHHASEPSSSESETAFFGRLRDHIALTLCQTLSRKKGYLMTPDVGKPRDELIDRSLAWLADLLTATPPSRLLVPLPGAPYDPSRHEPITGRPGEGKLKIAVTLFPGYFVFGEAETVVEKALVYTDEVEEG